jgi:two-component system, OmpR family, sensor histidine kinase VicK
VTGEEERTETISGVENTLPLFLGCFARVKERNDSCGDHTLPSVVVTTEPIKKTYRELLRRGIKTRFVTEITKKNIEYCKELRKMVYELRHLEGVKGNFSVTESDYIAMTIQQKNQLIPQLIYCNASPMVEQQQYFFDILWHKAIPAEQKIREIEEAIPVETTEVVRGIENIVRNQVEGLSFTKIQHDACVDSTFPSSLLSSKMVWDKCLELRNRGVKMRTITEIIPKNIAYCKRMVERMELRHLDAIRGNFSISDKKIYRGSAAMHEGEPPTEGIRSTTKVFVDQQQYFFETLWNKAIPAEQRFREIEEGIKPEVIETIRDPKVTQERVFELIRSANEEILILFSTSNAFRRQERAGAVDFLLRTAKSKDVKVRILSPFDDHVTNLIDKIKRENKIRIEIRNIEEPLQTKVSVLIVDRASLLSAELKSDSKETSLEAIGLATYSNSKETVLSYASIFESLWNQTELYEETRRLYQQLKSHDKMKQEFMDIAAHELRTPIQPILGLAQVLKNQVSDSSQIKFLDVILRNAKRLEQLQEDMLDVTRIESGSMKLYKELFNLNEFIFNVLQDFRIQLKDDARIKLNYRSDGDVWVVADKNRIIQVISNLLANAIKFTIAGRILVELRKRKGKKIANSNQVIVSIKDEGPGIDPSIIPRLFTKFASKSEKGTGLGLFISKSIIEAHGGKIWAKNNRVSQRRSRVGGIGDGAIFSFSLPVKLSQ